MNRVVLSRSLAVVSAASALAVVLPSAAFASPAPFSGQANGSVTSSQLSTTAGTTAASTVGESTAAVNSAGGIVPKVAGLPGNQNHATAVGTATPVRVVAPPLGLRANPGSVESTAPGSAAGSRTLVGVTAAAGGAHATVAVGRASTAGTAHPDGSNPAARGDVTLTNTTGSLTLPPVAGPGAVTTSVPVSSSHSATSQTGGVVQAQNTTSATSSAAGVPITALNGFITADQISSLSRSIAGGGRSANTTNFAVSNLRLRSAPGGPALLTVSGQKAAGGNVALTITLDQGAGLAPVTQTITIPGGKNLLDPASYTGTTLAPAFTVFGPLVAPLTAAGSPLAHLILALGGGYSDSGNGTYARGLVNAVQLSTALAGGLNSTVTLGQSFSAADAIRAFSTATNPALPPGTVPTANPIIAFPGTRQAVPVQTVFSNPVPTGPGAPGTPGTPGTPGAPGGVRSGSLVPGSGIVISPIGLSSLAPISPALAPANAPAAAPAASPAAATGQLPYTGVDAGSLIGLGLLVLVTGTGLCVLVRLATTRPARHSD